MPTLPYWLWPGDDRPTPEIDDEIAEELRLHLDLLAEEETRHGLAPDEAKQRAADRFGDFDSLVRRCRLVKQGDAPMLKRTQAVLIGLLLVGVAFLGVRQWRAEASAAQFMNQTTLSLNTILSDLKVLTEPADGAPTGPGDATSINLHVVDETGHALPWARLIFDYDSDDLTKFYEVAADQNGKYRTGLTFRDNYLSSVVAIAPGYAFTQTSLGRPFEEGEELVIRLSPTVKQRLRLVAAPQDDGDEPRPVADAEVGFVQRSTPEGKSFRALRHTVFQSVKTDAEGFVELDWFAQGDMALIQAWAPGVTWYSSPFRIEGPIAPSDGANGEALTVQLSQQVSIFGSGGGGFSGGGQN